MPEFTTWLHRTHTGRVVYARKENTFRGTDVLRILRALWFNAWRWVETDFRELWWQIFGLAARAAAENGIRVLRWFSDFMRQALEFLWNLVTFENADDAYALAQDLRRQSEDWLDLAKGYGGGPQMASLNPWMTLPDNSVKKEG